MKFQKYLCLGCRVIVITTFISVFAVPGFAGNTMILPDIQVQQDETWTFVLSFTNQEEIAGLELWLTYDSTIGFEVIDVLMTARMHGWSLEWAIDASDPARVEVHVLVFALGLTLSDGSGDVVAFTYQTSSDGAGGSALELSRVLLSDSEGNPLQVTSQNGWVKFASLDLSGNDVSGDQISSPLVSSVPEPTTLLLVGVGLLGLLGFGLRTWSKRK